MIELDFDSVSLMPLFLLTNINICSGVVNYVITVYPSSSLSHETFINQKIPDKFYIQMNSRPGRSCLLFVISHTELQDNIIFGNWLTVCDVLASTGCVR